MVSACQTGTCSGDERLLAVMLYEIELSLGYKKISSVSWRKADIMCLKDPGGIAL